MDRNKGKK